MNTNNTRISEIPVFRVNFGAEECYFVERLGTGITKFLFEYNFVESKVGIAGQVIGICLNSTDDLNKFSDN